MRSRRPHRVWSRGLAAFLIALLTALCALAAPAAAQTTVDLSASTLTPTEGETVTITVTLGEAATKATAMTLGYGGTAVPRHADLARPGADYIAVSAPAIAAGETTVTFTLTIIDDTVADPGETITVQAILATNPPIRSQNLTLTIVDNDGGGTQTPTATPTPTSTPTPTPSIMCTGQTSAALNRDCTTLLALKNALDPSNKLNWADSLALSSWNGVSFVTAANGVHTINSVFWSGGLSGVVPAGLGSLPWLYDLYLGDQELSGGIPPELGNLANLENLDLSSNALTGDIPTELNGLGALLTLNLRGNQLTGGVPAPDGQGGLASLTSLAVDNNMLTGSIPSELGTITNLNQLLLNNNMLSGKIPAELGTLASLNNLLAQNNMLSEEIPPELGDLTNLITLNLSENRLSGEIPSELGQLSNLQSLNLACNDLSGAVPSEIGDLPALRELILFGNPKLALGASDLPANLGAMKRAGLTVTVSGTCPGQETTVTPVSPRTTTTANPPRSTSPTTTANPPRPTPTPTPTIIGRTVCAEAVERPGERLLLRRLDRPGASLEIAIGRFSYMRRHEDLPAPTVARLSRAIADGSYVTLGGFIRETLGQTYLVVRRDLDGRVVRRWVPPDSPVVYEIPWPIVNTRYTVPTCVAAAIPLDEQFPAPRQMARRFEGDDVRIFGFDPALARWRWVPDIATLQTWGFYWCDVTVADPTFFARLPGGTLGTPYPASDAPERGDYPICHTITPSTPAPRRR